MHLDFIHPTDEDDYHEHADLRLKTIVLLIQLYMRAIYGIYCLVVTSYYRPQQLGSPHAHNRAIDIRTKTLPGRSAKNLADWLNCYFAYSSNPIKKYKIALYKPEAPGGPHMHIQVPPRGEMVHLREEKVSA